MSNDEILKKYFDACHAMQTGVAFEMERGSTDTLPKHLRVGVNVALCNNGALVRLLIAKGVFTEAEYNAELLAEMEREVKRYEERIEKNHAVKITLG